MAGASGQLVLFALDGQRYGFPLNAVERIVPAVEVMPLSGAKDPVRGMINLHGHAVPVFELRRILGLPGRELGLTDRFIIVDARGRKAALIVDHVLGISAESVEAERQAESLPLDGPFARCVVKLGEDFVVVCDANQLPLPAEAQPAVAASR